MIAPRPVTGLLLALGLLAGCAPATPATAPLAGPRTGPRTGPPGTEAATPAPAASRTAEPPRRPVLDRGHDYDGDGYPDLAIGAPGRKAESGDAGTPGAVAILWGTAAGLALPGGDRAPTVLRSPAGGRGDGFGSALAAGDFDGDGTSDLAVGTPKHGPGRGGVTLLFGGPKPFARTREVRLPAQRLAAGDFDGDGRDDLAIAGHATVHVLIDGRLDLVKKTASAGPIAAGDVTGDGRADLAVVYSDDDPADEGTGVVYPGTAQGLGKPPPGRGFDGWGVSGLDIGDLDGDGHGDVVAGNGWADASDPGGQITVLPGSPEGLGRPVLWSQASPGVPGESVDGDGFGTLLSVGDANGDGYADVLAGAPAKDLEGAVFLLYGGPDGVSGAGARMLLPPRSPGGGTVRAFGFPPALRQLDRDPEAEILVTAFSSHEVTVLDGGSEVTFGAEQVPIRTGDARFGVVIE
ncbi:FG-GAP-like repeat-containing protein [Nonomuraea sp. NPDC050310]|uniref:VCBS repeat-containing protein n=1 Tax=Nonomuraea sp. NPDC050310 TaxID=3154935 RepID=UPI0033D09DFD